MFSCHKHVFYKTPSSSPNDCQSPKQRPIWRFLQTTFCTVSWRPSSLDRIMVVSWFGWSITKLHSDIRLEAKIAHNSICGNSVCVCMSLDGDICRRKHFRRANFYAALFPSWSALAWFLKGSCIPSRFQPMYISPRHLSGFCQRVTITIYPLQCYLVSMLVTYVELTLI